MRLRHRRPHRQRRQRHDAVERYLRRLSRWAPRSRRHDLVLEAERHLYDGTRHWMELGLPRTEAQRRALRAFGPAWRIGLAAHGLGDSGWTEGLKGLGLEGLRRLLALPRPRRCRSRGRSRMRRLPRIRLF